jgi:hypothetical protein
MPFPLTQSGSFHIPKRPGGADQPLAAAEASLRRAGADTVQRAGHQLTFTVPRRVRARPLWPVTAGAITLEPTNNGFHVTFDLSLRRLVATTVALTIIWSFLGITLADVPFALGVAVTPIAWFWVFGTSYMWLAYRFPRFLYEALVSGPVGAAERPAPAT